MGNVGTISPVSALGSWLGTQTANSAAKNQGIFAAGRPTTPADLQAINSVVSGQPAQNLIDGYVGSPRGVVNLDQAGQEVVNYGNFLKATDPAAFKKYTDLLTNGVNNYIAAHPGTDPVTATGIVLATQPYADPQHPTPSENMRTSIGLDLRAAAILYGKSLASQQ